MKVNIVVWTHKYGRNAWPVFADSKPPLDEIEQGLRDSGDWTESDGDWPDTYLTVYGPFDLPTQEPDAVIRNHAPDVDAVSVSTSGAWAIVVERDEVGDVSITVRDEVSGTEERCVLGKEGTTTKA